MANQGAKKRKEENARHMANIRCLIVACNVIYVVLRMLIFHYTFTWKNWIALLLTSVAYHIPYQQLAQMANPTYADDGELLDGGFDMTTGGVCGKQKTDKKNVLLRNHVKFPVVIVKRKLTPWSIIDRDQIVSMVIDPSSEESYRETTAYTKFRQKEKPSFAKKLGNLDVPNTNTKRRILGLMEKAASSITLKDILRKYPVPSDYS